MTFDATTSSLIPAPPVEEITKKEVSSPKIGRHGNKKSDFDLQMFEAFEECRSRHDVLRTDPLAQNVQRRRLPGPLHLIAVHEPDLFVKKRPASIPQCVAVNEPFDPTKFNFTKVTDPRELLMEVQLEGERHSILVNVSPLMYGHGLLIPWMKQNRPQRLTADAIRLAVGVLAECQDDGPCECRIGFNSLGAFSSVNHLHLHVLYPDELDRAGDDLFVDGAQGFPIERCAIQRTLRTTKACQVDLLDWKAPCFSFQSGDRSTLETVVSRLVDTLYQRSIPHNVLFCRTTSLRVIVIPRQPQHHFDAQTAGFNAALGEISGYLVSRTLDDYLAFEERKVVELFQKFVACEDSVIESLCAELEE